MKWFNRKPKTTSVFDDFRTRVRASHGEWIEWPANVNLALARESFFLYEVTAGTHGTVWIRKKPNA